MCQVTTKGFSKIMRFFQYISTTELNKLFNDTKPLKIELLLLKYKQKMVSSSHYSYILLSILVNISKQAVPT